MLTHRKTLLQKLAVPLVSITISLLLLTFNIVRPRVNLLEIGFGYLLFPFQKSINSLDSMASDMQNYFQLLDSLRRENRLLKMQLEIQNKEITNLKEGEAALARMQRLLDFQKRKPYEVTAARVVGIDPSNWFNVVIIDKGNKEGIKEEMPVITHRGIVGQVIRVSKHFSKVMLVMDQRSGVGAMVQRTRAIGVVEGQLSNIALLKYLEPTAKVSLNDVVISSGLGEVFPKGLVVGTVTSIERERTGVYQLVEVALAVDFSRLEEVLVIKNAQSPEALALQGEGEK